MHIHTYVHSHTCTCTSTLMHAHTNILTFIFTLTNPVTYIVFGVRKYCFIALFVIYSKCVMVTNLRLDQPSIFFNMRKQKLSLSM